MLIKNLEQGWLVNGSQGKVINFMRPRDAQRSRTDIGIVGDVMQKGSEAATRLEELIKEEKVWPLVHFTNGREVRKFCDIKCTTNLTLSQDARSSC